jgi:hypothetical protein
MKKKLRKAEIYDKWEDKKDRLRKFRAKKRNLENKRLLNSFNFTRADTKGRGRPKLYAVEFEEPEPRCGFFHDVKSSK